MFKHVEYIDKLSLREAFKGFLVLLHSTASAATATANCKNIAQINIAQV